MLVEAHKKTMARLTQNVEKHINVENEKRETVKQETIQKDLDDLENLLK